MITTKLDPQAISYQTSQSRLQCLWHSSTPCT